MITSAGYYDFTRQGGSGDGGELIYDDTGEYIAGVRIHLTDNMFGDNNAVNVIRDPGVAGEDASRILVDPQSPGAPVVAA